MKKLKYARPDFLESVVQQDAYARWLHRKAQAHVRRDRDRRNPEATVEKYKKAIHQAVCESLGRDAYTNEFLEWNMIGTYHNEKSKEQGREYKAGLALLPTVDHVGDGTGQPDFKICGWRTNDAKNDLPLADFVDLCRKVVAANPLISSAGNRSPGKDG
jgi:hypothetical protein